jgi:hypothetical protein
VCGTDSRLKGELVGTEIVTTILVRVRMSVRKGQYVKQWAGRIAECYSVVGEG